MNKIDKILTDNPFVDELVYYTKLLAVNAVIKDEEEATAAESLESAKASDIYIACREGRGRFDHFTYDENFLRANTILTEELIREYARDNTRIPDGNMKNNLTKIKIEWYLETYNELNTYYRMLNGKPAINAPSIFVKPEYVSGITGVDISKAIHTMNIDELTILYSHGIVDMIIEDHPDDRYLNFMGDNAIDIYKARISNKFQILYIPIINNSEILDKWNVKYEQNRMYTLKTVYSEAYKFGSDYYDKFMIVFILIQTMIDVICEVQEFIARKDIFDDRSIRYIFESSGIPYYPEIPRKFQLAMIRNMHVLLKFKASTKNMIDICSLFGFKEIEIFRYYLLRDRRFVEDGDIIKWNDQYQFNYKEIEDINGNPITVDDNDANYDLKFIKVPIDDKVDNYIKDRRTFEDYDDITYQDEYWDGGYPHEQVKSQILDKEFSWVRSKYISIDTIYDLTTLSFDLPYFINLLFDDTIIEENLVIYVPHIKNNHRFKLSNIFAYLFALTYEYNEIEDNIIDTGSKVLSILGFNFHYDLYELANDLWENNYQAKLERLGATPFLTPQRELLNFDELLELFTQNKYIYGIVVDGMRNADNKKIYDAYKKIYETYFITDLTFTFFKLSDGTQAKTYTQFLQERDYVLYESILEIRALSDKDSKQKQIADTIIDVIYALDEYMDTDEFRYVFARFPAVSADFVRTYMLKIIDFFKSYKVHMLGISTVYKSFDKRENTIRLIDDIRLTCKFNYNELMSIVEDITASINLTKSEKIDLIERVWFSVERWEFKDLKDKFEMEIKNSIAAIMVSMTQSDYFELIDHEKDFPFYEIIYTIERGEYAAIFENLKNSIKIELHDKEISPFDKIKFNITCEKKPDINTLNTGYDILNIIPYDIRPIPTSINFESSIPVLDASIIQYDISLNKDGSIIAYIDTSNVIHWCSNGIIQTNEDSSILFGLYENITSINFNGLLDTSSVTNMSGMFAYCTSLSTLDLSSFNTSNVTNMDSMFEECNKLTSIIGLDKFNTSNVTDMYRMFYNCTSLSTTFTISKILTDYYNMFLNAATIFPAKITVDYTEDIDPYIDTYISTKSADSNVVKVIKIYNKLNTGVNILNIISYKVIPTVTSIVFESSIPVLDSSITKYDISLNKDGSIIAYIDSNKVMHWCSNGIIQTNEDSSKLFYNYKNITSINFNGVFNTSNVKDMSYMFYNCTSLSTLNLSNFNTSSVINMSGMFAYCNSLSTIIGLDKFNTSNVTNMSGMFISCNKLSTTFTISEVLTDYSKMFYNAAILSPAKITVDYTSATANTIDDYIDTKSADSNVVKVIKIFKLDAGYNIIPDTIRDIPTSIVFESTIPVLDSSITTYDISLNKDNSIIAYIDSNKVMHWCSIGIIQANEYSSNLFYNYTNITSINFNGLFDTSNVTSMYQMFCQCTSLSTLDLSNFNTSNVTSMYQMFCQCTSLSTLDLSNFNTSNVTSMSDMFSDCYSLSTLDLSSFNTSNVTDMSYMFSSCTSLSTLDLSSFNTSNVTSMYNMFSNCTSLSTLDLSNWNTSNVTNMSYMFYGCKALSTLDLSSFDTSNVTDMSLMFNNCNSLSTLDLSSFNTSNVTNMNGMFQHCTSLTSLDLSTFDTSNVINIYWMFSDCKALSTLDLSSFNTSNVINMSLMFFECHKLSTTFTIFKVLTNYSDMFTNAAMVPPAKIIVNYTPATANVIDEYIATKSPSSNVVKGIQV